MTNPQGDRELDAAMSDPVLASLFNDLQAVANEPAPAIGDALTAVLAGAAPLSVETRRTRSRRLALVALASTGALTAGIGAAAAADRLPEPLQRVVAKVVNGVTPFDVPGAPADTERSPATGPLGDDSGSTSSRSESSDDDASEPADDRDDTRSDDDGHEGETTRSGGDDGDDSDGEDGSHQEESDGGDSSSNDGSDGDSSSNDSDDGSDSSSDDSDSSDGSDGPDNSDNSDSDGSDDH